MFLFSLLLLSLTYILKSFAIFSFVTAIELLGNPAEMYMAGAQFWMICVSFVIIVPISSQLYLPVFMRLRLTSCYEYLVMYQDIF